MNHLISPAIEQQLRTLGIASQAFHLRVDALLAVEAPRLGRLWSYYRNPARPSDASDATSSPYRQAQEWGLPRRIKGDPGAADSVRREVVIENDIGWRIDTMVDFLFGKELMISSTAPDEGRRRVVTQLLRAIFTNHGGPAFLQQLALVGAVYGYVDVLVKLLPNPDPCQSPAPPLDHNEPSPSAIEPSPEAIARLARRVRFEVVEPARALPVLSPADFSVVDAYAQVYRLPGRHQSSAESEDGGRGQSWVRRLFGARGLTRHVRDDVIAIDVITSTRWSTLLDNRVAASGVNSLGRIPLVHIQNVAVPFAYSGASDVEPLLPLQDELNTRLSDRAHRIALQSFRMYLGRGIDGFTEQVVSPGRMWTSDDPNAQITEFGGDSACPSEEAHIRDLREAIDKASGVSPIAAGAIKGRIGRLTSAAALRVTMLALLSRTERKRSLYGEGIARMCELALAWLDCAGVFATSPDERAIDIQWPNPIPLNEIERLEEAQHKLNIGVPRETVLRELGY